MADTKTNRNDIDSYLYINHKMMTLCPDVTAIMDIPVPTADLPAPAGHNRETRLPKPGARTLFSCSLVGPFMQQPLSQRGQKRQQAILEAATETFLQNGYEGTTLNMIIARAGGSRRSLYDYFGDKQRLFSAVIRYHTDKLVEDVRAIDVTGMPAREGLTVLARNFVFALLEPVNLELYRLLITQAPAFPELARSAYLAGPALLLNELEKYLDHLQRQGQLPASLPTPHTARQFLGMVKAEFQLCALLSPERMPPDSAIDAHIGDCVALLLDNR